MPTLRQPALNAGNGTALYARLSPLLMVLALAIIVVPEEASFFVGGLRLTLARAILLALTPLCFVRFIQQVGRGDYRFVWSDALVLPAGVCGIQPLSTWWTAWRSPGFTEVARIQWPSVSGFTV